jgi:hypothetical protein
MHIIKMKQYILFVAQLYHFYADILSGILYMFMCPILVSMASLLTSCNNTIMQNTPSNGAGRRLTPHPFLAIILSHTAIYLYFHINPICIEYVCIVSYKDM